MAQEQIHEDIKWLEDQLEAKKRELAGSGAEMKEEKEMVRDVIRETPSASTPPPQTKSSISDDDVKKSSAELTEKKHHEIVEELVRIAFTKDLASAFKIARQMNNPHLMDEFHDTLADKYYEKLQQARKLK